MERESCHSVKAIPIIHQSTVRMGAQSHYKKRKRTASVNCHVSFINTPVTNAYRDCEELLTRKLGKDSCLRVTIESGLYVFSATPVTAFYTLTIIIEVKYRVLLQASVSHSFNVLYL